MAEEEYEPIIRRIRELEEFVRRRQDTIDYLKTVLEVRRTETGMTHEQLMVADPTYRHTFYAIRSLEGWQTRYRRLIEELKKVVPPIEFLRVILTFSIETGEGHEPFYAEVTCDTVIPAEMPEETKSELVERIANAVIKLFWIIFDALKDVTKDKQELWGKEAYDKVLKRVIFFQKYAKEISETAMDNLLKMIRELGGLLRSPEEYVTQQAIIKIGVEYHYAFKEAEPKYPIIGILIEKGTSPATKGDWVIEKRIIMADKTDVNILEILEIRLERT